MSMSDWTRRRFLSTAAAVGGGVALLGHGLPGIVAGEKSMTHDDLFRKHFRFSLSDAGDAVRRVQSRGAEYGDVYFEDTIRSGLTMENGKIRNVSHTEDSGVGLRAVRGETQAFGYTQSFDGDEIRRIAAEVAAVESAGPIVPEPAGKHPVSAGGLYAADNPSVLIGAKDKLSLLERADKAARAYSPLVERVDISMAEELRIIGVVTSTGQSFVDLQPMLRFNVTVYAKKGEKKQRGYAAGGGRMGLEYFDSVTPEDLAKEACRIAVEMLDAKAAPAGEQTIVLAPGDSGVVLHEAVGHGLEADFNRKGTSKYAGRVGQMVASELCTVVDEGLIARSRGAIHADDEGCPATRNVLIEKGKLVGYMHDYISAKHYNLPQSGNGRRQSYRHLTVPRMTSTYLMAGESEPEEVIKSTKKGIYCKTFSGGQVNISNGDFVFQVVESYLIEDGRLTAPLKDVVIIGNGPDALGKVTMVGNDLVQSDGRWTCGKAGQQVPVGVGIPTVKMEGITVGGTA